MMTYTYTTLDYLGPYRTFLYDINNQGQIIGQYTTYGVNFLYSTSDGTFTPLPNLDNPFGPSTYAYATGINDSGQIVGYWNGNGPEGFIYSNGIFTDLRDPNPFGVTATLPNAINNLGEIVGSY